ncbi:hypothetical protein M8J77_006323 [Diaphorina citri]|nr:hypothetical protein M8J77_006323 [Diaphorina citri]
MATMCLVHPVCLFLLSLLPFILSSPTPLYLTPLLSSGNYREAQSQSHVTDFIPGVPEAGYSGFFTIDEARGTHLHFWFMPKRNCASWKTEPLALWLQGGRGLSTLRGALQENMFPFMTGEDGVVRVNDNDLTQYANILMVDNTRVGFSHTLDPTYMVTDYDMLAEELYAALTQFFLLFPDVKRSVYIGGTSAAAFKIPPLGEMILRRNRTVVDLSGVIIGDGFVDLETDVSKVGDYMYNFGLIEKAVARNTSNTLEALHATSKAGNSELTTHYFIAGISDEINKRIGFKNMDQQDIMQAFRFHDHWLDFIELPEIRAKLHVGQLPYTVIYGPAEKFFGIYPGKRPKDRLEYILNKRIPLLKYHGQYDGILTYQSSIATLYNLDWYGQNCLRTKQFRRSQVWVSGQLFGYIRRCFGLWEVLAIQSPHVVQLKKPKALWLMAYRFMKNTTSQGSAPHGFDSHRGRNLF